MIDAPQRAYPWPVTTRREILHLGAITASALLARCSTEPVLKVGGTVEIAKADVPVGGGVILADSAVVVTQPLEGEFVAFSAVCTHQGCLVREVRQTGIYCACHGSLFDSGDGSPIEGPASRPLVPATITDEGDSLKVTT